MARPQLYDDELRQRLLDRAAQIIAIEGVDRLSLRRVSSLEGTSTNAIYTLFGGKDQLVECVVVEADRSFTAAQESVALTREPAEDLQALGVAYRTWALQHPSLYAVMFDGRLPGPTTAPNDSCDQPPPSLVPLTKTVSAAHDLGLLEPATVAEAVASIWAMIHGLVSLEIAGLTESKPQSHLTAIARAWIRPSARDGRAEAHRSSGGP